MSIVIDVALVLTFILFILSFTRNGFAGTIIRMGKGWISLFFSIVLNPLVSGGLHTLIICPAITKGVKNSLVSLLDAAPSEYSLGQLFERFPGGFVRVLNNFNISLTELAAEYGTSTEASEEIINDIAGKVAVPCSKAISSILAYIICFVASLIFFAWLRKKIQQRRNHFFRIVDGIMGAVVGTAIGFCVVFGVSTLVYTMFQLIIAFDASSSVISIHEQSYVFRFLTSIDVAAAVKNLI